MPYIIIILVLAALDQITKQLMYNVSGGVQGFSIPIIDKFFHLTYVENHGGVFGLLQGKINLFTIASAVLIIYVIAVEYKNFKNYSKWTKIGVAVIAAGAAGNMIDRILRGYVIDMIDFRGIWAFVFNVADMYVHIGIYIIVIDYLVRKYLKKNSVLDFDDLMLKTIVLFEKHSEVLALYQNKFEYIHVDEYQDTNVIQYKLIKMLSEVHKNICVVGDDDQSIYSWRGACSDNIINFEKDYEDVEVIFLDQNYRSNSTILDAANAVIKNNTDRKDKALWSENKGGDKITVYSAANDKDETDDIAKKILDLKAQGIDYKDIAILYRANYLSRSMENSCMAFGIPYKLIGSLKFLQRQEIRDLLAYMNVIVNKNDVKTVIDILAENGEEAYELGTIVKGDEKINLY